MPKIRMSLACLVISLAVIIGIAAADIQTLTYEYDMLGQLVVVDYGTTSEFYTYDTVGNRTTETVYPSGDIQNNPPDAPELLYPANESAEMDTQIELAWSSTDPDIGNKITHSIYFGEENQLELLRSGVYGTIYTVGPLKPKTTYYWRIEARDNFNATAVSQVFSFKTRNQAPVVPTGEFPVNDSPVAYENVNLRWYCQDYDTMDSLRYDIYFGTSASPPLLNSDVVKTAIALGQLSPGTTYYWQIVAKDLYGAATPGPVWSFDTLAHAPQVLTNLTYDVDTVLTKEGGPYLVNNSLTVLPNTTLTIEPGTVFKMGINAKLVIQGSLSAQGTAENRIVFTSYRDDAYIGDTNGDGFVSTPAPGDWNQIYFTNTSQNCLLEYVDILYAGYGGSTGQAVYINDTSPVLSNCTIRHSPRDGIYVQAGSPQIANSSVSDCARYGIYVASGSPLIDGNTFTQRQLRCLSGQRRRSNRYKQHP